MDRLLDESDLIDYDKKGNYWKHKKLNKLMTRCPSCRRLNEIHGPKFKNGYLTFQCFWCERNVGMKIVEGNKKEAKLKQALNVPVLTSTPTTLI